MKKILLFILIFLTAAVCTTAQQNIPCCPDFTIEALNGMGRECCMRCDAVADSGTVGGGQQPGHGCMGNPIVACKNSYGRFEVYPNLPGFTYQWTITGGTPATVTGNPVTILWGNGTNAGITVVITGPGCSKTITRKVCLLDKPIAAFTFSPASPICENTLVTFTNNSAGGSLFTWFFGDGTTSTDANPQHLYTTAGSYVVSLVVSSASSGQGPAQGGGCGCVDTIKKTIVVVKGAGIETCNKMLCPGDYAEYCSTSTCSTYSWSITGGAIIGPTNQKCVKVQWNTAPGSLTLTTTGCGPCTTTTITPSVIWPTLPVTGPSPVCVGSTNSYSLPVIPGTFYSWSISPGVGATIMSGGLPYPNNYPVNNPTVNVNFTQAGTYTLTGTYTNPNTKKKCGGTGSIIITVLPKFNIYGPGSVCQNTTGTYGTTDGSVATWSITPGSGYLPLTFPNGPIINVNWLTPGNYVLTSVPVTGSNYCNPLGVSIAIQVKPAPALSFVTPQTTVCPNSLVNYSVTSSLPGNITWSFTAGTGNIYPFGTDNTSASVDFTGAGPWTLKAEQTVNGCAGNVTVNITAVPAPPAITLSAPSVCSGGSVTASVTGTIPPGGYVWSCSPGAVLTGGQGTLSATFTVNSNATITLTSCGGSSSASVTVTPTTVSITRVNTACGATLTASPGGGSYQWFLNGSPFGSGVSVNIIQNGTYVVVATYPGNCTANSQIVVTGLNPVTVSISATGNICNGNQVTIVATVSANCTSPVYTWSGGGPNSPTHVVGAAGSYSVTVTCANGCTATSNVITIPPCVTGPGITCTPGLSITGNNNCNNPVNLSVTPPAGCSPVSTTWYYGDGFSGPTGVHQYTNPGIYPVLVIMQCADGSYHCGTLNVTVPLIDSFTYVITCAAGGWNVLLQDASIYLPAYSSYTRVWTTNCGTFTPPSPTGPNPTLFVPVGCNPTVNLQITLANGCILNKSFTFNFPNSAFTITGNQTPCKNEDNVYQTSFTTNVISYAWNFGDGTSGVTNPISHHFSGTPVSPTISLTITDQWGCQFTTTLPVTVKIPPALTITPSPIVKICPDCPPVTTTLSTSPLTGFNTYQWYRNGAAISGANASTYQVCPGAGIGSYYVTAMSNAGPTGPCAVKSDTVKVVYHPKPDAVISPRNVQCVFAFPATINNVHSGALYNPNYTYTWYLNNTGNQIFTSTTTNFLTYTVNAASCNVFIVKVTDNVTGCVAYDTACICFSQNPTVNIAPPGPFCAGTTQTFMATAGPLPPPQYTYVWQDGTLGQNYTTSFAGTYTVTAFNIYGCSNSASTFIKPLPYVALFPQGCDTLCLGDSLFFPIPLDNSGNPSYTITWYKGATVIGTGFSIPTIGLGLGAHTIHAVVVMNGCTVTTAKLLLVLINCKPCDCKESHWGEIQLTEGEKAAAKNNVKANVPAPIILKCKSGQKLDCNKTYTIDASYFCKDTACNKKVTYVLQPSVGSPITGTLPLTFTTPNSNTVYVLTLYGWCGDKICDSCVIDLIVECGDCCKGSVWEQSPWYSFDNGPQKKLNCNEKEQVIDISGDLCKQKLIFGATIKCPPDCKSTDSVFVYDAGNNLVQSGPAPLTLNTLTDGTYTVEIVGYCGGLPCLKCKVIVRIKCDKKCDCNEKEPIQLSVTIDGKVKQIRCDTDMGKLDCNKIITLAGSYSCNPKDCPSNLTYTMTGPGGPVSGTLPLTINTGTLTNGTYTILIQAYCNGKLCKECKITFTVDCERPCCPYKIEATAGTIKYDYTQIPGATVAAQTFTINGLALANITEVRANVVSYTITDNFDKECMKCVNLPFTWASIATAANIGAVPGLITMYGGTTVPAFTGSGAGAYQNPREVVWNNGTPISIPNGTNIGINFILPAVPKIDCCELKGKICVKFTFRDNDCKECEVIACFDFVIKKK